MFTYCNNEMQIYEKNGIIKMVFYLNIKYCLVLNQKRDMDRSYLDAK